MRFRYNLLLFILLLALPALACGGDATPTSTNGSNSDEILSPTPERISYTPTPQRPSFGQTSEATLTPQPDLPNVTVKGTRVNIRSGPGTNYAVIQTLDQDETAPATGFNSGQTWVQIQLPNGTTGWVSADLVDIDSSDEIPTITDLSPAPVATTPSQQPPSSDTTVETIPSQQPSSSDNNESSGGDIEDPPPVATVTSQPPPVGCVDINHASKEDLKRIIHIDDERADQIIVLRTQWSFRDVDGLTRVNGIGPARLREIKEQGLACVAP